MAPPTSELRASILDDHNERLRDLEGHRAELSSQMAAASVKIDTVTTKVEELGESMKTGMEVLGSKIEGLVQPISKKLVEIDERFDDHSNQLAELQKSEKTRKTGERSRSKKVKVIVMAALVAAAGYFGGKVAETAWNHIGPHQAQAAQVQGK